MTIRKNERLALNLAIAGCLSASAFAAAGVATPKVTPAPAVGMTPSDKEVSNRIDPSGWIGGLYYKGTTHAHGDGTGKGTGKIGCVFDSTDNAAEYQKNYFYAEEPLTYTIRGGATVTRGRASMALTAPFSIDFFPRAKQSAAYALTPVGTAATVDPGYVAWTLVTRSFNAITKTYSDTQTIDYFLDGSSTRAPDGRFNNTAAWKIPASASNYPWVTRIYNERIAQWFFDTYVPRGEESNALFKTGRPTHADFRGGSGTRKNNYRHEPFDSCMNKIKDIAQNILDQYTGLRNATLTKIAQDSERRCTKKEWNMLLGMWNTGSPYAHQYRIMNRIAVFQRFGANVICANSAARPQDFTSAYAKQISANPFHPVYWGIIDVFKPEYTGYKFKKLGDYPEADSVYMNGFEAKAGPSLLNTYFIKAVNK